VQSRWPQKDKQILIVDVGGGSAEIIHSVNGTMREGISRPLGAVRLTEVFLKNDPPTELELRRLDEYIDEKLQRAMSRIAVRKFDRAIATSATAAALVCAINRIPRARRDEANQLRATLTQVRKFYKEICRMPIGSRKKLPGIGPRRAEILIAGTAVFLKVMESFGILSLSYSTAGVRDGIIADLAARGVGRELSRLSRDQLRATETMAMRYGVPLKHARKVAQLGHTLFEALQPMHKLAPSEGRILEAAAYLHDTGHYVSDTGHHKHSAYLVQNSDLPGFTDPERVLIAQLCRYHRKAMPTPRHEAFQALTPDGKRTLIALIPLLRLADSLDTGQEDRVKGVQCEIRPGLVHLQVQAERDADLEIWAAERVSDAFRQIFGLGLSLARARRSGT
jgi:exopolyphosphatase/guanosine-5'-triphosphate,3'-diphosphate pyrophosphatase